MVRNNINQMRPDAKQHVYAQSEQSTRMPSLTQENVWISTKNEIEMG